ncbi:Anti-sigma-I factor RsgI [Peribacillus sp. Bi96]|uniref:anti-sigma factor domain-containing protein n=1 Tax=Peribacillus sp. Bi96 TaxID=2884273 RepID=UPI001D84EB6A|nr:anti-sigma factor domain-containing protein [Peribacillus sp. Bi96]CAH0204203.1 Anti-sigma-I factor RsgI [Peribacillus sp. Bi96]
MKKGVILSVNKSFVTLLTPEGEFLKTKRQERVYEVGEEITFAPVKQKVSFSLPSFHSSFKKKAVISIASTFLILFLILPSYFSGHVSAYMTIDVNPSIELELDDHLEVLKLTGLNADGKLVIDQLKNWRGKDIKAVTNRIVATTKQLGYLKGEKQIVVSTTVLDKDKKFDKNLKEEIKEISEQDNVSKTKMKVIEATKKDREQAKEQGISTGKYVEKKLNEDTEKVKVNKREPVPAAPEKKVEEKVDSSTEKSAAQSNKSSSDEEKKKEDNSNEIKQKTVKEAKPMVRQNLETVPAPTKEKTNSEDKNENRNEINDFKKKNKEPKRESVSKHSTQSNHSSQSTRNNHNLQSNHSNQLRDKQKNEKADKKLVERRYPDKEKGREKEKNKNDHSKHENKKDKQERDKWKRGNGNDENKHGRNN